MNTSVTIDPLLISLIAGAIIPVIVAFSTKLKSSAGVKSVVGIALSVVAGTLTQITNSNGTFDLKQTAVASLITLVTSLTAYNGFWKPVVAVNSKALPSIGIGATQPSAAPQA
ncbi:hypothetical protein UFOVP238_37 [uncultured Caudovirales phage]|uniref:Holin n=1 Tax=uncultured Caudovirales phage TaxID=2100421 RepID=A0A6J7WQQ2_9CAUD|nr:hypothetical protein UFOVP238_37 [uncultured Caudovirales phage]